MCHNCDNEEKCNNQFNNNFYLQERKSAWDATLEVSRLYDKAIITLSGGAFGLSIAYLQQVVGTTPSFLWYLKAAWIGFTLSLLSALGSLLASQQALDEHFRILTRMYIEQGALKDTKNLMSTFTLLLNIFSAITFIFGAILLACFSIKNL